MNRVDFEKLCKKYFGSESGSVSQSLFAEIETLLPTEFTKQGLSELLSEFLPASDIELLFDDLDSSDLFTREAFLSKIKENF